VTGTRWRGQIRRVRTVLYRRIKVRGRVPPAVEVEADLNDVAIKWVAALASAGIKAKRGTGEDLYSWLLPWFNPRPNVSDGDAEGLLEIVPYPGDEDLPFGNDLAERLTLSMPESDNDTATWWFDGLPHTTVTIQGLRRAPDIGHMTAERLSGDHVFALFDRLPEHTVMALTLTVRPQDLTRNHIARVKRSAVGDSAEAALTREDADAVEREMARGNRLYPLAIAFYLHGENLKDLRANVNQLNALLLPNGLQPITQEVDLLALDAYIRNLPMAYDPGLDRLSRRSRLVFSSHTANLLPVYGRSRGTGHPGLVFFNRGAEPLVFDPLHREDRKKNAHMLILGPTGAGKSALLVYLLQQMAAVYRPRIFIIEAGGSFALLAQHFQAHGLTVNPIVLNPNADVSLPPFADALKLLDRERRAKLTPDTEVLAEDDEEDPDEEGGGRDILGEMEIAARIMITGGDEREDARMTRADRLLIRNAIFLAAKTVREQGKDQVLTEDVVAALQQIAKDQALPEHRRNRALEMGDGMELFCSGLAGHFFNRSGRHWPEADVTLLEMGILAREGYEDQLTVAYISMMSHINDLVERHQSDARPTLVLTDEGAHHHHQSLAGPLRGQDHQDVAQARHLVLDRHSEPGGLPGCQPQDAQHDGVVAVPGDAQGGGGADRPLQGPDRRAAQPAAVGEEGARQVRRGRGAGRQPGGPVPQRPATAVPGAGHDREAREGGAGGHHARAWLQRAGGGADHGRAYCPGAWCIARQADEETRRWVERVSGSRGPGGRRGCAQALFRFCSSMSSIRRFASSFPLVVLAASLTVGDAAWAAPEEVTPIRIEVFTARDRPIQPPSSDDRASLPPIEVYEIDGITRFEVGLSDELPADPEMAQRLIRKRLERIDASRLDHARQSVAGLINAAEYGVDRYPAIVFDGDAVFYGVTNIDEALRHYRQWKRRALQ
jgi:integrating conjugative element protein (TIGR03757 family)